LSRSWPFAGGGIVGLTAGFEGLAQHVVLVERDPNVAAVWHAILGGQAKWLADQILNFDLTREIPSLASEFRLDTQAIAMKNTHHAKMTELVIGKDLSFSTPALAAWLV